MAAERLHIENFACYYDNSRPYSLHVRCLDGSKAGQVAADRLAQTESANQAAPLRLRNAGRMMGRCRPA